MLVSCSTPEPVVEGDFYAIELHGHRIGIERREESASHRSYAFLVDGVPTDLVVDGDHGNDPVHSDGLVFRPLDAADATVSERVDLVGILRQPSERLVSPRKSRHGSYTIGGVPLVVEHPLAVEVPRAGLAAIRDLVARTRAGTDGDCKAHAALFVELANQATWQARVVDGLVYIDGEWGTGFHPHQWSELLVGERWVPVDPILDQPIADATHVPMSPRAVVDRVPLQVVEIR